MLWEKSGPIVNFNLIFLGLGWPWVGEFVGFMINLPGICFPTQQNLVDRKHPINSILYGMKYLRVHRSD